MLMLEEGAIITRLLKETPIMIFSSEKIGRESVRISDSMIR